MNLLERIKASSCEAAAESISTNELDISSDEDLFVLTDSAPASRFAVGQQSYELPNRALFLAIYEAALRRPRFFNVQNFREYKKWLLDGSCYVLNTFKSVDPDRLLELYLAHKPPDSTGALFPLASLLWEVDLCVPEDYQKDFEQIITDEGERMTKNFP